MNIKHIKSCDFAQQASIHKPLFEHFDVRVNSNGSQKTADSHVALCGNISAPVRVTDLVEASKDTASLVVCTRIKIFCLGCVFLSVMS